MELGGRHQGNLRTSSGSSLGRGLLLGHALLLHRCLLLSRPGCQLVDLLREGLRVTNLVTPLLTLHGHQHFLVHQCREQEARRVHRLPPEERVQNDRGDRLLGGMVIQQGLDLLEGDPLIAEEAAAG